MTDVPVLEPERRQKHIDKIDRSHGLLPIAMDCLRYQENERPSSEELWERLAGLKETREYRESMERVEREQNDIAELERQIGEMQIREGATIQENHRLVGEVQSKEERLQTAERQHEEQERELRSRIGQLNRQLAEQEQVTAEIQQTNHSLQREVEQLQQQLSQQTGLNTKPSQPPSPVALEAQVSGRQLQQHHPMKVKQPQPSPRQGQPHPPERMVMLGEWRDRGKAPVRMSRGAAVVDGNVAYFLNWNGRIYSYNKRWSELPQCPGSNSSLAVVGALLTAIGGYRGGYRGGLQNKLLSLVDKKWVEHFPPMPTKRCYTAAATTQHHLIVAGGESRSNPLNTVEVMDIQTLVWSTAASLPHPYAWASAAICGDQLFMLGGYDKGIRTKSVLTCSLTSLLQSRSKTSSHPVWKRISDTPVYRSSCVAVRGELLAVGGEGLIMTTSAVCKYEPTTDSWDLISNMLTSRYHCLVAVLPTNEMMVVGGGTFETVAIHYHYV